MNILISMILGWFSAAWQERYIDYLWDCKPDHEIRANWFDSAEWIQTGMESNVESETVDRIVKDSIVRMRDTIWPQIEKRNMQGRLS